MRESKTNYNISIRKQQKLSDTIRRQQRQNFIAKKRMQRNFIHEEEDDQLEKNACILDRRFEGEINKFGSLQICLENVENYLTALYDPNILQVHFGMFALKQLMNDPDPPVYVLNPQGIVSELIKNLAKNQFPQLQLYAVTIFASITSGICRVPQDKISLQIIPYMIELLNSQHAPIVYQAVYALGNIAIDSIAHRDLIIKMGGLNALIQGAQNRFSIQIAESVIWAITNICRGYPAPMYHSVRVGIKYLIEFLSSKTKNQCLKKRNAIDAAWAICFNTSTSEEIIEDLLQIGILQMMTPLLQIHETLEKSSLEEAVISILARMTSGSQQQVMRIISEPGILDRIQLFIGNQQKIVRVKACKTLANIAKCDQQILLSRQDALNMLLNAFETDALQVKNQVCQIFVNMINLNHPSNLYQFFIRADIMHYYLALLYNTPQNTQIIVLQSISSILQFGEHVKEFFCFQQNPFTTQISTKGGQALLLSIEHQNKETSCIASSLLQKHFHYP